MIKPYITSLYVDTYRGLYDFKIDFNEKLNILVGPNGIGKSTIIGILKSVFTEPYYSFFDRESMVKNSYACISLKSTKLIQKDITELRLPARITKYSYSDNYVNSIRNILNKIPEDIASSQQVDISEILNKKLIPVIALYGFDIGKSTFFVSENSIYAVSFTSYLKDIMGENMLDFSESNFINKVTRHAQSQVQINNMLSTFLKRITIKINQILKLNGQSIVYEEVPNLSYKLITSRGLPINRLSSGEEQLEKLSFLLRSINLNKYDIVLLDEPELHLNYGQMLVFSEIMNAAKKQKTQLFIATHSSFFLKSANSEIIKFLTYDHNHLPTLSPINSSELKRVISFPELFFSRSVVLVEDLRDKILFERSLSVINKEKNRSTFFSKNIEFIDAHGKSGFVRIVNFCHNHNISYKIITDDDFIKKESDFSYIKGKDIEKIRKMISTISIQKFSSSLLRSLNKSDAESLIRLINGIFEDKKQPQEYQDIYSTIKGKIAINQISISNIINTVQRRKLNSIFRINHTWILEAGNVDSYINSNLKEEGKLSLSKLNDNFYPEETNDLKVFFEKNVIHELSKMSDFIYE